MPVGEKTKLLWQNPVYRQMMSNLHKGKATNKGKRWKISEEARERISGRRSNFAGKNHTVEAIETNRKLHLGRNKGSQNGFWKGGTSRCYKTGYYSRDYKEWRRKVFERDNFKCRKCGAVDTYFTAHHIKSFAHFPELRFAVNNGLTLCEDCHSKTDNYKGRAIKQCVQQQ